MKKLLVSLLLLSGTFAAFAQNEFLVAAEKYFNEGDYFSASQYYEKYLSGEKPKNSASFNPYAVSASTKTVAATSTNMETILFKLAESYRLLNYPEKAATNYKKVLDLGPSKYPLARFHYATSLRALARYSEAETEFKTFLSEYKQSDKVSETAQMEINNLQYIQQQLVKKDLSLYTITKAGSGLNETGGSYAPVWAADNSLFFTSTRPSTEDKGDKYINRIYQAQYSEGVAGNVALIDIQQPNEVQQGVIAITPDGNTMFISRWMVGKGKKTSSIYSSKKNGNKWTDPQPVEALNAEGSNSQQPHVMADGKYILFSSDKPGSVGGFDLWYAELDATGNVGTPVNLGSAINTKYDEQAPSYHPASNTLVFSTNGRTGMGGFDFFHSKGSVNSFTTPQNFGYPVNSIKDDLYFASRGSARNILEDVVLSSDRDAACCLELFTLNKKKPLKNISGTVISCETKAPLAGVSLSFVDENNKVVAEKTTDASGSYSFTLEEYQLLKATGTLSGYFTNSQRFNTPDDAESDILMNSPLCLSVIPEVAITVDNVYYDFNKATLKDESFPSLDSLVVLLNNNPTMDIELSAHTDSKGSDDYNLKLSDARAKSVVEYLISKGINPSRLIAKGYGEAAPVSDNTNADGSDNPEGRQKNRRTEFKVLKN